MSEPEKLGALTTVTILSTLLGAALWVEGIGAFLSVVLAVQTWWTVGLLYEIKWRIG